MTQQKHEIFKYYKHMMVIIFTSIQFGSTTSNLQPYVIKQYAKTCEQYGNGFDSTNMLILGCISVSLLIGAFMGSFMTGKLILIFGYKKLAIFSAFCTVVANFMPFLPISWWYLCISRFVIGIFNSFLTAVIPPWISELLPFHLGATMNGLAQMFINSGILLSAILMLIAQQKNELFFTSFLGSIVSSFLTAITCLTIKDNHTCAFNRSAKNSQFNNPNTGKMKSKQKLYQKKFLKAILLVVCIKCLIECSGINVVIIYGQLIFQNAFKDISKNKSQIYGSILIAVINLVSGILPIPFNRNMKRRQMLFIAVSICVTGVVIYFFAYLFADISSKQADQSLIVVATVFFLVGFNFGLGPAFFVLSSELIPSECQPICTSVASIVHWTSNIVIIMAFPLSTKKLWIFFLPILVIMVVSAVILQIMLPETSSMSKQEIEEKLFDEKRSKKKVQKNSLKMQKEGDSLIVDSK